MRPIRFLPLAAPAALVVALVAGPVLADDHEMAPLPGTMDQTRVTAGSYVTDPAHTLVEWTVDHFGFNDYFGLFGNVEGTLNLDPADISAASVMVTIPVSSLAVVSEGLREHLLRGGKDGVQPDFFGPEPEAAIFRSTSVTPGDEAGEATITGNLTLNGVTRPVTIEAQFAGAGVNPISKAETVGFAGETTIRRSDFGLEFAVPVISDEVELKISAAFEKR